MSTETKQLAESTNEYECLVNADVRAAFAVIANNSMEEHIRVFALAMFERTKLNPVVFPSTWKPKESGYKTCPVCKTQWLGEPEKCPRCEGSDGR